MCMHTHACIYVRMYVYSRKKSVSAVGGGASCPPDGQAPKKSECLLACTLSPRACMYLRMYICMHVAMFGDI